MACQRGLARARHHAGASHGQASQRHQRQPETGGAGAGGRDHDASVAGVGRAGRVYGIVRLMSLDPHILRSSMALYQRTTSGPDSVLPRWFRELVAVTVSRLNDCFY